MLQKTNGPFGPQERLPSIFSITRFAAGIVALGAVAGEVALELLHADTTNMKATAVSVS